MTPPDDLWTAEKVAMAIGAALNESFEWQVKDVGVPALAGDGETWVFPVTMAHGEQFVIQVDPAER